MPISEFQIGSTIALQNSNGIELLSAFHVVPERTKMTGSDKNSFLSCSTVMAIKRETATGVDRITSYSFTIFGHDCSCT